MGRQFGWLWSAYAVSTLGTWLAFDAFSLLAILVLHAGPGQVSVLAAAGMAVGALVAVPLGPWIEFRRKRPVMIAMDLIRFAALMTIPAAFALGWLGFPQLLVVSVVTGAADITFKSASGAYLKVLVTGEDLLVANGRFESTTWTSTALGPPLGGAAFGLFGPMTTVLANAASFLLSAAGIRAIGGSEPRPARDGAARLRIRDLPDGWRYILGHAALRPLFFNTIAVGALILAPAPSLAVLMLGRLHFAPWQYGLAFAVPCLGGLLGARLSRRLVARFGRHQVMRTAGTVRACFPVGLAFIGPGVAGLGGGHGDRAGADHRHRRVQPGVCHLPAGPDAARPGGPHVVGVVGHHQRHHRGPDRRVGPAGQSHQPACRARDRRPAVAGHPAAAAAP
ncbi:MAG TPA: MFS transporter [Streptosporangiaceae bacterium]|nr:MFS transporter [Streptosporangiaceae bacterium]